MEDYLYKEVYVVGVDVTTSISGELKICDSFEDLLKHLKTKNASVTSDLRVIHGVLTAAKTIPKELHGRQAFVLLKDPDEDDHGLLLDSEAEDYIELGEEIKEQLDTGEAASFFFEIEDVFIVYGYEMTLTLSVDEDDVDDDIIEVCMSISNEAKKLNREED